MSAMDVLIYSASIASPTVDFVANCAQKSFAQLGVQMKRPSVECAKVNFAMIAVTGECLNVEVVNNTSAINARGGPDVASIEVVKASSVPIVRKLVLRNVKIVES